MNKIKALITAVVLASSSAAMAAPLTISTSVRGSVSLNGGVSFQTGYSSSTIRTHRTPTRAPVRPAPVRVDRSYNDRFDSYEAQLPVRQYNNLRDWLVLGMRDSGTTTHFTMPTNEPLFALHLEATSGRPAISSIFVRYHDGSQQEIPVNANLSRGGITVPLVVKNSPIHQIIFWSPEQAQGTFTASVAK